MDEDVCVVYIPTYIVPEEPCTACMCTGLISLPLGGGMLQYINKGTCSIRFVSLEQDKCKETLYKIIHIRFLKTPSTVL
jgi:hypothetical protein